jgi:DUF1707 SHOCT-like domain
METDSRNFPRGGIRVSDADRDRAVTELSEHFQSGRLSQDEFEERSGRAFQARTGEDLSGLFGDLPQQPVVQAGPASGVPAGGFAAGCDLPVQPPRPGLPAARLVIGVAIALVIVANVAGGAIGHGHGLGWLIPFVLLGMVFLRLGRRR